MERLERARRRIGELEYLHAFISQTTEVGDGDIVAVKDLVDVAGTVTTGGGILLPPVPAQQDAEVIARLRRSGCVVIGKTNLHEWAYGVTSNNPHYGAVLNPYDPARVAGGSSGGSAVAAATGMCDWAVGTDTGGSIRIPAAFCGVVGFKPTLGAVPTAGVVPLSRTLDTMGPLAPDVATAARAFWVMTGDMPRALEPAGEARLAVAADWVFGLDDTTAEAWALVSRDLPEIPFADREELAAVADTILRFEAAEFHRRWLSERPAGYGADVRLRLERAALVTSQEYESALEARVRLSQAANDALEGWDAILLPVAARTAPLLTETDVLEPLTRFTRPLNATGQPVVALPARTRGLPVGIQVAGRLGAEAALLNVAAALEKKWAAA